MLADVVQGRRQGGRAAHLGDRLPHLPATAQKTPETLAPFLAPLRSRYTVTTSYPAVRSSLEGPCTGRGSMPILVTEYNSGPGWVTSNYGGTSSDAVFPAASTVRALRANVSTFMIFNVPTYRPSYGGSMMTGSDRVGPEGLLSSSASRPGRSRSSPSA